VGVSDHSGSLIVIGTAVLLGVAASTGGQTTGLTVALHTFQDSRGVTVLSPDLSFDRDFTDRSAVRVKFGVDAISAASDSCARCHPEGANNSRIVGGASVVRKYGDYKLTVGGEISSERFYSATTGLTSISRDLNRGNTTIAGGFAYSLNRPELHPSQTVETQHSFDAYGSVTQSWTKTTITQFGYELNQINGYQTNPFLRTRLNGLMTLGNSPDVRTRQALTARLRQAFPNQTFLEAEYRRYFDSWDVGSNTATFGLSHHFGERVVAGGSYRWYDQTGAYFYAPFYVGSPEYFTGDFRLAPFNSGSVSGQLTITPQNGLWSMPHGSSLNVMYERYRATTGFEAAIITAGIHVPLR